MRQFEKIFLLHGKGGSPDGTVSKLTEGLAGQNPHVPFVRPLLLHHRPETPAEVSYGDFLGMQHHIPRGSLIIGVSMGGLLASKLQEERIIAGGRPDVHVISISSPENIDGLRLEKKCANRVALYSSNDVVIADRATRWPELTNQAYDLPWLMHNTDLHIHSLVYLINAYIQGRDLKYEVEHLFEAPTE